ncbi:hypothetical protein Syun_018275 [Stephania yunnanensis]|uniref:Uncharacterized protein n=1 Tax=Stephania yunnanensis TaxID=152371 RepID=A0AAP0IRY3_9MAGN
MEASSWDIGGLLWQHRSWRRDPLPTASRETIERYVEELQKLILCLLEMIAKNLGVEAERLTNTCNNGTQWLRMNY